MRLIVTLLIFLIGLASALAIAAPPPLPDQFGFNRGLNAAASPVLVVVVDARRLRRIKKWEAALIERYPDLDLLRVADVPREPPVELAAVSEQLRKRVPPEVPVTIDLGGRWSSEFELDVAEPCLLLFSAGELVAQHCGAFSEELLALLVVDLDDVVGEAR